MKPLPAAIAAVCAQFFGRYVGRGTWSPPNRCGNCPLYQPCLARGGTPVTSYAQLDEARSTFDTAAEPLAAAYLEFSDASR